VYSKIIVCFISWVIAVVSVLLYSLLNLLLHSAGSFSDINVEIAILLSLTLVIQFDIHKNTFVYINIRRKRQTRMEAGCEI